MTNEEMAVEIQNGRTELMSELWEQNTRFFTFKSWQIYNSCREQCASSGVEFEDIYQSCYFALCDAVKAFDTEPGYKLLSYTKYPLKTQLQELCGIRSSRRDVLNNCASLDEAIGDDENFTRIDIVADPNSEEAFIESEDKIFQVEMCEALESALSRLPDKKQAAVRGMYLYGKTQSDIASEMGVSISRIHQMQKEVFRQLKCDERIKAIRDEILVSSAWKKTGLAAFNETWSSSVELALERAESFKGGVLYERTVNA